MKSGTFRFTPEPAPVFTLSCRSEFERTKLDCMETIDYLRTSIETLFGIHAEIVFELAINAPHSV